MEVKVFIKYHSIFFFHPFYYYSKFCTGTLMPGSCKPPTCIESYDNRVSWHNGLLSSSRNAMVYKFVKMFKLLQTSSFLISLRLWLWLCLGVNMFQQILLSSGGFLTVPFYSKLLSLLIEGWFIRPLIFRYFLPPPLKNKHKNPQKT